MAGPLPFLDTLEDWFRGFIFGSHLPSTPFSVVCNTGLACLSGEHNKIVQGSGWLPRPGLFVSTAFVLPWGTLSGSV